VREIDIPVVIDTGFGDYEAGVRRADMAIADTDGGRQKISRLKEVQ
jgi:hypothetical protein